MQIHQPCLWIRSSLRPLGSWRKTLVFGCSLQPFLLYPLVLDDHISFSTCTIHCWGTPVHWFLLFSESLEGTIPTPPLSAVLANPSLKHIGSNDPSFQDYYVTVQLFADNKPLAVPVQTRYKALKGNRKWNEWLRLPIRVSDCPRSAQLAMTVWEPDGNAPDGRKPFGGTTLSLYENDKLVGSPSAGE